MNISMTNCMRCGSANVGGAQFCSGCGATLGFQNIGPQPVQKTGNGRAILALVLGIVGLVLCGFTAIPGAILAWMEMQAVREGRAPQANGGMAKAAFWINIAALVLTVFFCLGFGLLGSLSGY
ncbi:MAG: DUF4190 domain-containing protein [Acidobacteria bacterium]|nr:DUF4190 domain-containing protein [Acidobacteriota bacterium]